jgi:competence protein ComEA
MPPTEPDRRLDRWTSWLQATPAELVGLSLLLLGGLAVAGVLWWQSANLPTELPTTGADVGAAGDPGGAAAVGDEVSPGGHDALGGAVPADGGAAASDGVDDPHDPHGAPRPGEETPLTSGDVVVHVSGAVARPGLVTLRAGARVGDAIDAVGGPADDAEPERLNLARPLRDGEHVHLPRQGEEPPAGWDAHGPGGDDGTGPWAGEPVGSGGGAGADGGGGRTADGRIDLNRATAAELEDLPGMGPAKAAAIVSHREEHGPFREPGDLRAVTGIGEKTFQGLADLVAVS